MVIQGPDGSVEFRFYRPGARQVFLAGEFNAWQEGCLSMLRDASGFWHARLALAPGEYQFRYLADGQWFNDYAAFGLEKGPFGWNSVLKIDQPLEQPESKKTADRDRQAA